MVNGVEASKGPRKSEFVYFIRAELTGLIKIGVSRDMEKRLSALQTGSPDKLVVLGVIRCTSPRERELQLHGMFRRDWDHGEWFRPSEALLSLIAAEAVSLEADAENKRAAMIQSWLDRGIITGDPAWRRNLDRPDETGHPASAPAPQPKLSNRKAILAQYKAARGLS